MSADVVSYKGYHGSVSFSEDDRCLFGRLLGIEDIVTFEGASVEELTDSFRAAVDDYLQLCEKVGKNPQKAYSGKIPLRIDPTLHGQCVVCATSEGKSLNSWIADLLDDIVKSSRSST